MSSTTFGDLRSAVEEALVNPQRVDQVVWLLGTAPDAATAEVWLEHAVSKLERREHARVNLGDVVRWAVQGAALLPGSIAPQGLKPVDAAICARLMAGWAWSVVCRPEAAPFIQLYSPDQSAAFVALYEGSRWCCRTNGQPATLTDVQILLINQEWQGPGQIVMAT